MMDSEQRRKRKRPLKQLALPHHHCLSVRSLIFCFSFAAFLFLLSGHLRIRSVVLRPALVVPSLSLLSSSATDLIHRSDDIDGVSPLRIEDRVLFPDHILVLASNRQKVDTERLDCVYYRKLGSDEIVRVRRDHRVLSKSALSVDVYEEFRSIVRCPLPPLNYSEVVNLQRRGKEDGSDLLLQINQTLPSWEKVAYAAQLDGDSAVVFVKGLNLRPGKEHDPAQFVCHLGPEIWEKDERSLLTVKAIAAAQEVIRCSLPTSIQTNPNKGEGIRVSIGMASHIRTKPNIRTPVYRTVPSVAQISNTKRYVRENEEKSELCVCTMVWNQASSLREWVTYHSWLGVERWFIYDNNSDDDIKEVIEELELDNYNVSRHTWPWIKTQEAGFSHCALRAKNECKWVGFLDVDEFFYFPFPHHHGSNTLSLPGGNSLRALVSNFSFSTTIGEIRTACHSFGPSGLLSPPSQGVTVGYTCRLQSPERHKSIVRPDALDNTLLNVVHHFRLRGGFRYLNLPQSTAVINHYKYQVWETFRAKFFRRVATYVADWRENQNEGSRDRAPGLGTEPIEPSNWRLQFCEVWDTGLRDFVLANLADPATELLPWQRPLQ